MSRLDDLKRKRDQLQKACEENSKQEARLWYAIQQMSEISTTDPVGQMWSQSVKEGKRLSNELQKIEQALSEEEKAIASPKPSTQSKPGSSSHNVSRRDSDYYKAEFSCGRCGRPMGPTQVVCYNCLSIGHVRSDDR